MVRRDGPVGMIRPYLHSFQVASLDCNYSTLMATKLRDDAANRMLTKRKLTIVKGYQG